MTLSIHRRIQAYLVGITALVLVSFSILLYLSVRRSLIAGVDAELRAQATALAALVEKEGRSWEVELEGGDGSAAGVLRNLTAWSIVTHPERRLLLGSPGVADLGVRYRLEVELPESSELEAEFRPVMLAARSADSLEGRGRAFVAIFAVREEREDDDESEEDNDVVVFGSELDPATVEILVATDLAPTDAALRVLLGTLVGLGVVALAAGTGAAALLSRRILGPLARISNDAEAVRVPDGSGKVRGSGAGDEIDRLADTLNRVFERLHDAYERQTRFTADASHELRTPVASIRTQAEVALRRDRTPEEQRETLTVVRDEAIRLGELIEALLTMARLDSGKIDARLEPIRLDELARECVDELASAAEADDVRLRLHVEAAATVSADLGLLGIALRNLVSNAVRHASRPGTVDLHVSEASGCGVLEIRDDGPGIPVDAIPHLFERFYRAESARERAKGAAGLGLSIVAEIIELHDGSVGVQSSPSGATFVVRLPKRREGVQS